MERLKTKKLFEQALKVIPGGVNSPVRAFKETGISPMVVDYGLNDLIFDVDQHSYIDFCMSWGALILGHAHQEVVKKVQNRVALGSTFGITSKEEIELATFMTQTIRHIEKVRFVSSGTEAVMTAIRLARGYTKAKYLIKFDANYHGAIDALLIKAGSYLQSVSSTDGVIQEAINFTISLPYNDLDQAKKFFETFDEPIAAILIEPIAGNMGVVPADQAFLSYLRQVATEKKALLIFDEVISGFRVSYEGASFLYQIIPDLVCFGKIIGGGYPAACVAGKKEIMDHLAPIGNVYQAGTLSGNPVAMTAGLAVLQEIYKPDFYQRLNDKTLSFIRPIQEMLVDLDLPACIQQQGSMFTLFFGVKEVKGSQDLKNLDTSLFKKFFQHLFVHGVYIPPSQFESWFISEAHTLEHLEKAKMLIMEFLKKWAMNLEAKKVEMAEIG